MELMSEIGLALSKDDQKRMETGGTAPEVQTRFTKKAKFSLGRDPDGSDIMIDLSSSATCHAAILGGAGSGKSEMLRAVASSLVAQNDASALRLILIDPRGRSFPFANGSRYLASAVLQDPAVVFSQALALSDNTMRYARDAYALAAMVGSRSGGRGGVALVAPRFDAEDNPTRPSRLLLAGLRGEELARRIWHLARRHTPEPQLPLEGGPGFNAAPVQSLSPLERINVTAFRQYIESPRKFYFQQVLRLKAENDAATELQGAEVGTLLHEVLAAFGGDLSVRGSSDEKTIHDFISAQFDRLVRERFGRWAQPAVEIQVEEVRRRLTGFARVQAGVNRDGWEIRYVEGSARLECEMTTQVAPGKLRLSGKIDRIDYHPAQRKWRIVDYKTSAKGREPLAEHRARGGEWRDLQLPLYLKLAAPHVLEKWAATLTPDTCELTYFLLPEEESGARISLPFPPEMVEEAWQVAAELADKILRGEFDENPPLNTERNEPALLALCGQVGITASEPTLATEGA